MKLFAAVFCALLAVCVAEVSQRIVGGTTATYGEHPYICSLQVQSGGSWYHICGSVIWNNNNVVTAAHCLSGSASSLRVVCGLHRISNTDSYQVTRYLSSYTNHPSYNGNANGFPNDIAVMRLSSALSFNNYVNKITFATSGTFAGQSCKLSGWGRLVGGGATANTLQKVNMTALSHSACVSRWGSSYINSGHICFYEGSGTSACNGDSGGPVRCGSTLTGVTSWGQSTCGGTYPSVYTRVSYFNSWLVSQAGSQ
ncbi:chymotrypsin-like serine proteinase [Littorina saxatilis]|uniref:Peptidase S1 domain-containing protein n=1 Tax=Littorina saxatilis TaxID=31220 RepID=A0AAN9AVU8_9CAEN